MQDHDILRTLDGLRLTKLRVGDADTDTYDTDQVCAISKECTCSGGLAGGAGVQLTLVPSPRHTFHDHNSGSTEIYAVEIPIRILMTRSRY